MPGPNDSLRNKPLVYTPRPSLPVSQGIRPVPLWRRLIGGLWRALRRTCTTLGALVLTLSLLGAFSALQMTGTVAPPLPDTIVLHLDIDGDIPEKEMESTFSDPFAFRHLSILRVIEALDRAETDPRVKGIVAHLKNGNVGLAHIQELRAALKRFRATGKFAYIHATEYGDPGRGLGTYYLASAFEQIWMQPLGTLSIAGIGIESPYLKDLLDKIGVRAEFFQRKEYKTAFENLTHAEMTPENRVMMTRMIGNLGEQMLSDIAADRKITPVALRALIDRGLLLGKEALDGKLLDRVDYEDVLATQINARIGNQPEDEVPFVSLEAYYAAPVPGKAPPANGVPVALIYVVGAIVEGDSDSDKSPLLMGEQPASAQDIAQAITDAANDPAIPAIVLRINSPGGSPTASETIRRAIVRAQQKGKKVIVSMGDMAASGGYWIAAPADAIFALPATLTGSIGVVGGKFDLSGLWEKAGVTWDSLRWGQNAGFWTFNAPFSPSGAERMNAMLDEIYAAFVDRVAQGRKMSVDQVEKIAGGRVWTGAQAKKIGLVDTLGGIDSALDYTARQIGLGDRRDLGIEVLPRPLTPLERIIKTIEDQGAAIGAMASFQSALQNFTGAQAQKARPDAYALAPFLTPPR